MFRSEARKRLFALVDEVGESYAIEIHGKRNNAVLVSKTIGARFRNAVSHGNTRDAGVDCRRNGNANR